MSILIISIAIPDKGNNIIPINWELYFGKFWRNYIIKPISISNNSNIVIVDDSPEKRDTFYTYFDSNILLNDPNIPIKNDFDNKLLFPICKHTHIIYINNNLEIYDLKPEHFTIHYLSTSNYNVNNTFTIKFIITKPDEPICQIKPELNLANTIKLINLN